jgi:hypothetical protein
MFAPIPHSKIEDAHGLTGWPRFLLVDASEADAWFVAKVIIGRDLACHTMLFSNAQSMLAVMDGPEHKKIVDLIMVTARSLQIETHRILRVWGSATQPDLDLIAESAGGDHLACSTGTRIVPRRDLSPLLDIPA